MLGDSIYINFANQTLDWLPMDTQKLYKQNLKIRKSELEKYGWFENKVEYQFNNFGFRCPSFTEKSSIMFLGCSHTIGIGINYQHTWAYIVANHLKFENINVGQGGGSTDTCFRLANYWIPILKPKIVFLLRPNQYRLEIFSQNNISFAVPPDYYPFNECNGFFRHWLSNENNSLLNSEKNTMAIANICDQYNIKFVWLDSNKIKFVDHARDLAHGGIETNQNIAQKVLDIIEG